MSTTSDAAAWRRHHPNLEDVVNILGLRLWVGVDETRVRLAIATKAARLSEIL
jgi:ribosomal protein L28